MRRRWRRFRCFWRGCRWMDEVDGRLMCSRCGEVVRADYYRALMAELERK